jgi:hypothetical protein
MNRPGLLTRRRVVAVIGLTIVATLFLESDAVLRRVVVLRTAQVAGDCISMEGLAVNLGPFPATVRALRGHLDDVTATADTVDVKALRLRDLDVRVDRVRFPLTGEPRYMRLDHAAAS